MTTINLPTIHRSDEQVADGRVYIVLSDSNTRWSKATKVCDTIEKAYADARRIVARQFQIPADATIKDYHGTWLY